MPCEIVRRVVSLGKRKAFFSARDPGCENTRAKSGYSAARPLFGRHAFSFCDSDHAWQCSVAWGIRHHRLDKTEDLEIDILFAAHYSSNFVDLTHFSRLVGTVLTS